ncbi:putative transmembrane protein 244 isoform X2 [Pleurodeles waltl]|uniref:putative transmembrane protein 244 isoform X2 n=1 Tax=Pleurodeles waltl TaxID=8319 RepID=UPI0037097203
MTASVCFGAFRLDTFDGLIPFDFKTDLSDSHSKYLVQFALRTTLPTVIVMMEFPQIWQWWLAIGCGLFLMICNGQLVAHFACQSDQSYPVFDGS